MITFLEEVKTDSEEVILLADFSFTKSQNLENFKGSFSDAEPVGTWLAKLLLSFYTT
jgi:hypothetical protein